MSQNYYKNISHTILNVAFMRVNVIQIKTVIKTFVKVSAEHL